MKSKDKTVRDIIKEIYFDWAGESADKGHFDEDINEVVNDIWQLVEKELDKTSWTPNEFTFKIRTVLHTLILGGE